MKDPIRSMKQLFSALLVFTAFATPALGAGLQLSIQDGKVTLDAEDVTIRQILTEWARVGNTRIVNVERVAGGPITLKFEGLPEKQALDTILRTVPGYVAAPRATIVPNASVYETILVMATTTAVAPRPTPGAAFGGATPAAPFSGGPGGPGPNVTQLRPTPFIPTPVAENPEPEQEDRALAAAAAAGLIPGTGAAPATEGAAAVPIALPPPIGMPGGTPNPNAQPGGPTSVPLNPWNAPVGTAQPSLAPPPPAPSATQPISRPRPPQPDNR
jgi:hypothetical protein